MFKLPFEIKPCPQDCGKVCGEALDKCPVFPSFRPNFRKSARKTCTFSSTCTCFRWIKSGFRSISKKLRGSRRATKTPILFIKSATGFSSMFWLTLKISETTISPSNPALSIAQDNTLDEIEERLADYVEELEGVSRFLKAS